MLKIVYTQFVALVFVSLLVFAPITAYQTQAAVTVNNQVIADQKELVEDELLHTTEEYVKLLQMLLIVKLQERLAMLQAQSS